MSKSVSYSVVPRKNPQEPEAEYVSMPRLRPAAMSQSARCRNEFREPVP